MTNLVRRDPFFLDLFDFRRDFDQIFNRMLLDKPVWQENFVPEKGFDFLPAIEAYVDQRCKEVHLPRVPCPASSPRMWKSTPWETC